MGHQFDLEFFGPSHADAPAPTKKPPQGYIVSKDGERTKIKTKTGRPRKGSSSRANPPPCDHEPSERRVRLKLPRIVSDGTVTVRVLLTLCAKCNRPYQEPNQ